MKSIFKSMSCLVLGAMIVTPMFAQQKKLYPELEGPGPVVIISKDKNGKEELINVFEETQRPHFHDPRAPRFLLTDQQGKFALGIGGYLKTTMELITDRRGSRLRNECRDKVNVIHYLFKVGGENQAFG